MIRKLTLISEDLIDEKFSQDMENASTPKKQKKQIKKKGVQQQNR